jgi:hypothetical protein
VDLLEAGLQVSRRRPAALALVVAAGLAGAVSLQAARERIYPQIASPVDEIYFTSGEGVGRLALSFKSVLADVYWIRAIQYFAATRLKGRPAPREDLLYPLLDITTTLDPAFNIAYRFGAIFLCEGRQRGLARPELAVTLLDKGFAANPHKWQYVYDKAFVYYWTIRDPKQAAHWFAEAAKVPRSPEWLPGLAGYMLAQGGDRQSSRFLFQQIYQTAEHEYMRATAEWRLGQLDTLDLLEQVNAVLDRHAQAAGARARSWTPLISGGWLRGVPVDPGGTALVIDAATGRATVDISSKYFPLPDEPPPAIRRGPGAQPADQARPPS